MSKANLDRFQQLVLGNPALQEKLKVATDQSHFVQLAVRLGSENGCQFSSAEVEAYIAEMQGAAQEELSDAMLETVAGGSGVSYTLRLSTINGCTLDQGCKPGDPPGPVVA